MSTTFLPLGDIYFGAWREAVSLLSQLGNEVTRWATPYDPERSTETRHRESMQPFNVEQKKKWDGVRFGRLEQTQLGDLSSCVGEEEMAWPDYVRTFVSKKGYTLLYKGVDTEREVERVAEIYRRGVDEMIGNSLYDWHLDSKRIAERVRTGEFAIWGTYEDGQLIAVNSTEFVRGQRAVHWIWGAVDPAHRGKGVWENIGLYIDRVIELSGAQYGMVWMVTTHALSQRMAEKAGWKPVGVFPGGEFMGGSDGRYYRHTAVWYAKVYGDAQRHVQARQDMLLTPQAERVAEAVLGEQAWPFEKSRNPQDDL
jgi:RimJ/RimL family protein N-acetyltransferase